MNTSIYNYHKRSEFHWIIMMANVANSQNQAQWYIYLNSGTQLGVVSLIEADEPKQDCLHTKVNTFE